MGHNIVTPNRPDEVLDALINFKNKNPARVARWLVFCLLPTEIASGKMYQFRPSTGPLGRMYHDNQYDSMASSYLPVPPIPGLEVFPP